MDGIESAIRNALARGDARDRAFRERVYRSVFAALEKKIVETPDMSADEAQRRREVLKDRIIVIEREFVPRPAPAPSGPAVDHPSSQPASAAPVPSVDAPHRTAPVESFEPLEMTPRREAVPSGYTLPGVAGDTRDDYPDEAAQERRRPWGVLLIVVTVLAMAAIAGWWAVETGFFGRDDGSVPNPPVELEEEEFTPDAPPPLSGGDSAELDWITVFSPGDAAAVNTAPGASAEVLREEKTPFLRVRSGAPDAPITFGISRAALAAVAGGKAVFDIVARAQEGQESQISVSCNFRDLGDCGRRRYVVGLHRSDYLFEVELPSGQPGSDGAISIVTDVESGTRAIDIFEIRLAPAE